MEFRPVGPAMRSLSSEMSGLSTPIERSGVEEGGFKQAKAQNPLMKMAYDVSNVNNRAEQSSMMFALGETDNIHRVIIDMEESLIATKMAVQVRNKAVEAYQEIMRMQV
ncbi:MAG: flagellar hook-basal body complex protein FliE [Firmicutes bacterium]|nr:flagellar hook-basal body complex protein FliE [Bacillota bacterium]